MQYELTASDTKVMSNIYYEYLLANLIKGG